MYHLSFLALIFLSPARSSDEYRAAGNGAVRTALPHLATYDGDAHSCHARRCDQGRTRMDWHDPRTTIHARLLESHFCLAQGTSVVQSLLNMMMIPTCHWE
jgi:hypothetical protein